MTESIVHFYTGINRYSRQEIKVLCKEKRIPLIIKEYGDRLENGTTVGTRITCPKCMTIYLSQQEAKMQKLREYAARVLEPKFLPMPQQDHFASHKNEITSEIVKSFAMGGQE